MSVRRLCEIWSGGVKFRGLNPLAVAGAIVAVRVYQA